jgi:hypothetical protein
MAELTGTTMEARDEKGKLKISVSIEGESDMPFWKHDLKLKAIRELLKTVDKKDYIEEN